ncbi:cell wall-binding repeat-containing protein [Faecalimicrobium sp. JNUCC 81]
MLNKKNIAMTIAAFTVATSVTPAFAEGIKLYGRTISSGVENEFKASDLYNPKAATFTGYGNELIKFINRYNTVENGPNNIEIDMSADGLSLTIKFPSEEATTLVVKGSESEIETLGKILIGVTGIRIGSLRADVPEIFTLAGMNRRETAIEVSNLVFSHFGRDTKAKNVVLVSDYAIADGLTATPFANAIKAPVLLTDKNGISKEVMDEIERVMDNEGTVYLVGGESVLSKNIEAQLDAKFISNERIAGSNRQETSLKIAKKIANYNSIDRVFVTGGHAEADAMSVAGVAAQDGDYDIDGNQVDPIILAGNNGLTDAQTEWLELENAQDAVIVGGEAKVSLNVEEQLKDALTGEFKRIAGQRRQETNAKVIKEFYGGTKMSPRSIFVAKSDDKGLVDALSAGVIAAMDESPIVLATDELHITQEEALNSIDDKFIRNKVQIGYGVNSKVWESIKKIIR